MKAVALLLLAASIAHADDQPPRLDVELGKTIERNVGYARGWLCDDPTLVKAELVTRDDVNYWIVTGEKLGSTTCRVGTEPGRPSQVFDVVVIPAKKKKAP